MKRMKLLIWAFAVAFGLLGLAGCTYDSSAQNATNVKAADVIAPIDYGNGVYYFHATEAKFGNSLSYFIASHQSLELIAIAPDDTNGYGSTRGYFAVFRQKK